MTKIRALLIILSLSLLPLTLLAQDIEDEHAGHDHGEKAVEETKVDEHAGHDHGTESAAAKNEFGEEVLIVSLSLEAQKLAGIRLAKVSPGNIISRTNLPGEVGFNEDRLVHISPRFAGLAKEANYRVGNYVKAGAVVAVVESNESMNLYSIKAPISGWIIERHITPGEFVSGENSIYVLADLSTVWVNLAVYPKDVDLVQAGQEALITAVGSSKQITGEIDFVTPVLDALTRSSTARVLLKNENNGWRPGTFVHAEVVTAERECEMIIEKDAVQTIDEKTVVFVAIDADEFAVVEVVVGHADERYVSIEQGLTSTSHYVAAGAFELKAKIVTGSLSGHAGHGH